MNFFRRKSTEAQAEETILQKPIKFTLGGKDYEAERPSIATWIAFSTLTTELSKVPKEYTYLDLVNCSAQDLKVFVKVVALFIATARPSKDKEREQLAEELLHQAEPNDIAGAIETILQAVNINELFMLTTSLKEMNLTKATQGEVGTEATASGQE